MSAATTIVGGWSELSDDILDMIIHRLNDLTVDLVRFGAVCHSWRSSSLKHRLQCHDFLKSRTQIPWILTLATKRCSTPLIFYNFCDHKRYVFHLPPGLVKKTVIGCSNGYLVYTEGDLSGILRRQSSHQILYVANPLTGTHFTLPTVPFRFILDVRKAIIINNDNIGNNNLMVAVLTYNQTYVVVAKPGDNYWTYLRLNLSVVNDIIFHKGSLYVVAYDGTMLVFQNICDKYSLFQQPMTQNPPEKLEEEKQAGFQRTRKRVVESPDGSDLFMFVSVFFNSEQIDKLFKHDWIRGKWDLVNNNTFVDRGFSLFRGGDGRCFFLNKSQTDHVVATSHDLNINIARADKILTPKNVSESPYWWFMPSLA